MSKGTCRPASANNEFKYLTQVGQAVMGFARWCSEQPGPIAVGKTCNPDGIMGLAEQYCDEKGLQLAMMKYIRHADFGFVLFEKRQHHISMARRLGFDVKRITGAGFVMAVEEDAVTCGGESIMLRVRASQSDEKALQEELG